MLFSLPILAATQEAAPPEVPPLGTGYVLFLIVVLVAILAGFWWYYSRPEPGDDKSKPK